MALEILVVKKSFETLKLREHLGAKVAGKDIGNHPLGPLQVYL